MADHGNPNRTMSDPNAPFAAAIQAHRAGQRPPQPRPFPPPPPNRGVPRDPRNPAAPQPGFGGQASPGPVPVLGLQPQMYAAGGDTALPVGGVISDPYHPSTPASTTAPPWGQVSANPGTGASSAPSPGSTDANGAAGTFGASNTFDPLVPINGYQGSLPTYAGSFAQNISGSGAVGANDPTQIEVAKRYMDIATGKAPSLAQQQLQTSTQQQEATTAGQIGAIRGMSPATAARMILQQRAGAEANLNNSGAMLRSQEEQGALKGAAGVAADQQSQANQLYSTSAQAANQLQMEQELLRQETAGQNANLLLGTEQLKAGIAGQNSALNAAVVGSELNAAGAVANGIFSSANTWSLGGEVTEPSEGSYADAIRKYDAGGVTSAPLSSYYPSAPPAPSTSTGLSNTYTPLMYQGSQGPSAGGNGDSSAADSSAGSAGGSSGHGGHNNAGGVGWGNVAKGVAGLVATVMGMPAVGVPMMAAAAKDGIKGYMDANSSVPAGISEDAATAGNEQGGDPGGFGGYNTNGNDGYGPGGSGNGYGSSEGSSGEGSSGEGSSGGTSAGTGGEGFAAGGPVDLRNSKYIPGRAKHPDRDTEANDVVPAMVTPGEHITKRTVAQRPVVKDFLKKLDEDPDQAEAFLRAVRAHGRDRTGELLGQRKRLEAQLADIERQLRS